MHTAIGHSLNGKRILLTGATSGIGKEAALELARRGAHVVIHGRNKEKTAAVREELIRASGNSQVDVLLGDLSVKAEVLRLADEFNQRYGSLDVLINNAGGVMNKVRETTADGWERTIALNVLAPYMLTALLYPALQVRPGSRIVNTSSAAHRMAKANLDDFMYEKRYNALGAYGDAKYYVLLLGQELARRQQAYPGNHPVMNALHPGIVATNFAVESNSLYNFFFKFFRPFLISPRKGADTIIYLASHPEGGLSGGRYFMKRKVAKIHGPVPDSVKAGRLWALCEQYTGISLLNP